MLCVVDLKCLEIYIINPQIQNSYVYCNHISLERNWEEKIHTHQYVYMCLCIFYICTYLPCLGLFSPSYQGGFPFGTVFHFFPTWKTSFKEHFLHNVQVMSYLQLWVPENVFSLPSFFTNISCMWNSRLEIIMKRLLQQICFWDSRRNSDSCYFVYLLFSGIFKVLFVPFSEFPSNMSWWRSMLNYCAGLSVPCSSWKLLQSRKLSWVIAPFMFSFLYFKNSHYLDFGLVSWVCVILNFKEI